MTVSATTIGGGFITGEINLPPVLLQTFSESHVIIRLQDGSTIPEKEISKLTMELPYLDSASCIPFALSYPSSKLAADTPEWYTLRVLVKIKDDGSLLSFNHRITRAFDDAGLPLKNIQVPMMVVGTNLLAEKQQNFPHRRDVTPPRRTRPKKKGAVLTEETHQRYRPAKAESFEVESHPLIWV